MKVLASVARCQRTPPLVAKPKDLSFGLSRYIKQREQPEQSYRLQLEISPTRRNHHGQKTNLYTLVDPVSPPSEPIVRSLRSAPLRIQENPLSGLTPIAPQSALVEAPGTAPGSEKLIALAVYHHSQPILRTLTLCI